MPEPRPPIDDAAPGDHHTPVGVVLTAGAGTRLRPLTPAIPKALVPLVDRPLLGYALDALLALGIEELIVVVGGGDEATARWAREHPARPAIAVQERPLGPGDAVLCAPEARSGRPVIVWPVDTVLIGGDLGPQLRAFLDSGAQAWMPLAETDRPQEMGIAVVDEGDRITELEEKPAAPRSNLAVTGPWMLHPSVVERLHTDPVINARGEVDLTGTIARMREEGADVRGRRYDGRWLDGGAAASLLAAQRALLERTGDRIDPSAEVEGCEITSPVAIGAGARLLGCRLGPNVVVGAGSELRAVRARDALFAPGARLSGGEYREQLIPPRSATEANGRAPGAQGPA